MSLPSGPFFWSMSTLALLVAACAEPAALAPPRGTSSDAASAGRSPEGRAPGSQSKVVQIAAGTQHTCAVLEDGGVACWGANYAGQLGLGTRGDRVEPRRIPALSGVVEIAIGDDHTCARLRNGTVSCWGANGSGQVGNGRTDPVESVLLPSTVPGLAGVAGLRLGSNFSCARLQQGALTCWGGNERGQLGDGTTTRRLTPKTVAGLEDSVVEVAIAGETVAARLANGTVVLWGWKGIAVLGDPSVHELRTPTPIAGLAGVLELAVGNRLCVRLQDASVRCSGESYYGLGLVAPQPDAAELAPALSDVTHLVASRNHRCAILRGGNVKCWGHNTFGELGDGTEITREEPVDVRDLSGVVEIAVGSAYHSCARRNDGAVLCWGRNLHGGLGDGTKEDRSVPTAVHLDALR